MKEKAGHPGKMTTQSNVKYLKNTCYLGITTNKLVFHFGLNILNTKCAYGFNSRATLYIKSINDYFLQHFSYFKIIILVLTIWF